AVIDAAFEGLGGRAPGHVAHGEVIESVITSDRSHCLSGQLTGHVAHHVLTRGRAAGAAATSLDREVVDENDRLLESVRHTTILYVNLLLYDSPTLTKTRRSPGRSTLGSAGASSSQSSAARCGLVRGLRPSALEIGAARDRLRTRSVGPVLLSGLTVLPAALSTSCLPRNP